MKKVYIIMSFIVLLLIGFLGITYSYEYTGADSLTFELLGPYKLYLNLDDEYDEYGIKVMDNGVDISSQINIDSSSLDMNKVGEYKIKYSIDMDGNEEYVYRLVVVRENIKPEIILKGDEIIYLDLNETYIEPGYEVIDNYDIDLINKVIITSNLNVTVIGEYTIEYRVVDSSGNEGVTVRRIIVK